jgi:hypothetical protein
MDEGRIPEINSQQLPILMASEKILYNLPCENAEKVPKSCESLEFKNFSFPPKSTDDLRIKGKVPLLTFDS